MDGTITVTDSDYPDQVYEDVKGLLKNKKYDSLYALSYYNYTGSLKKNKVHLNDYDYNHLASINLISLEDYNHYFNQNLSLNNNEAYLYSYEGYNNPTISLENIPYTIKGQIKNRQLQANNCFAPNNISIVINQSALNNYKLKSKSYFIGFNASKKVVDEVTTATVSYTHLAYRGSVRFGNKMEDFLPGGPMSDSPACQIQQFDSIDEFIKKDLDIIKVEAFSHDEFEIQKVLPYFKDMKKIAYLSSYPDNVEITNENAQKGLILEKVIDLLNIKKEEVIVLGDGMNDITLFERFPYSFAPNNAEKVIQEKAYKVVSSCKDGAVSEAIEYALENL